MNDGKCIDGLGMYSCSCTANFTGENCTIPGIMCMHTVYNVSRNYVYHNVFY